MKRCGIFFRSILYAGMLLAPFCLNANAEEVIGIPHPVDFPYIVPYIANPPIYNYENVSISDDGNRLAMQVLYYKSQGTTTNGIVFYDKITNITKYISNEINVGYREVPRSVNPRISGNGNFIVYESTGNQLSVDGNNVPDIFVYNIGDGTTDRVSVTSSEVDGCTANDVSYGQIFTYAPSISYDGRYVAFASRCSGFTQDDTNYFVTDIFVRDRETGTTEKISRKYNGSPTTLDSSTPLISADGQKIIYVSRDNEIVLDDNNPYADLFVYDVVTKKNTLLLNWQELDIRDVFEFDISADGNKIVFATAADNLVLGDTNNYIDVFVYDVTTKKLDISSVSSDGFQGNGHSGHPNFRDFAISPDGNSVAFTSDATTLISEDFNGMRDIFVHNMLTGQTQRFGTAPFNHEPNGGSYTVDLNNNGNSIGFISRATNLVDYNLDANLRPFMSDTTITRDFDVDDDGFYYDVDCNDNNNSIFPGAIEIHYNGIDDNCNGMIDDDDLDLDGYGIVNDCSDSDPSINPGKPEIPYNGIDENCNGFTDDDDLDNDGHEITQDCNDYDQTIFSGASEVKQDGIDQDCNGYDLTINITSATYRAKSNKLSVDATSSLGASAALQLVGYGPMTYAGNKWSMTVVTGTKPETVVISGPEGSESTAVIAQ